MVQLRQRAVTPPFVCGMQGVGAQTKRLWEKVGNPRAPVVRLLWDVRAVDAVAEFLESTRVGRRTVSRVLGAREIEGQASEDRGKGGGPGPP